MSWISPTPSAARSLPCRLMHRRPVTGAINWRPSCAAGAPGWRRCSGSATVGWASASTSWIWAEPVNVDALLISISPVWVAVAASAGAIVGDSTGYLAGRLWGDRLFDLLGRRFPKHAGPDHLAYTEHVFARYGVWAVFFGRFVALLRIFAGPVAGALRMPYPRFLAANALGGLVWACGTTATVYTLGTNAEEWLKGSSWIGLIVVLGFGIALSTVFGRRLQLAVARYAAEREPHEDQLTRGVARRPT